MTIPATRQRISSFMRKARYGAPALTGAVFLTLAACNQTALQPVTKSPPPAAPHETPLALIPDPASVTRCSGYFDVDAHTPILAVDSQSAHIASWFADEIASTRDLRLSTTAKTPSDNRSIQFEIGQFEIGQFEIDGSQTAADADERYSLDVAPQGVRVRARTAHGLFNGATTLWQLMTLDGAQPVRVPCVHIEDQPRFVWRGLMLDPARHFQSVEFVKRFIDAMALHKFNVLHWHLTDDQGWRIEIKKYPKLTEVGAWRQPAGAGGYDENGKPFRYGGYYTQDQIRNIVAYAQARFITIVPEIEMPGHAQAAIAAYPQLGVTGKNPGVSRDWGVHTYLYNIDDATFTFLENVLDEVMALFPSPYIHIGGDEAAKDQWHASARVQARMHTLGIKDETALQAWFTKRIERFLSAHGRKLIGWDEILEGGIPEQATVMSWRGTKGATEASKQGHDVVLSPDPSLYFDHLPGDLPDEPPGRPAVLSVKDVYDFQVIPQDLDAAQAKHVLGAQAPLWSEYFRTDASVARAAFPRAAALAEVLWTPEDEHDWRSFLDRLGTQQARYRLLGLPYSQSAFAVRIDATLAANRQRTAVVLSNQTAFGTIRYTLDGSAPTRESPVYSNPLDLPVKGEIRANAFLQGAPLADARTRKLDVTSLLTRNSAELAQCNPKSGVILKLPEDAPAEATRDAFVVDIFDPCWEWPQANLDGIDHVEVDTASLPYNFQLWHDAKAIVERKPKSFPIGELEFFVDHCDGTPAKTVSIAPLLMRSASRMLTVPLGDISGSHDVCLRFATGKHDPMWIVRSARLVLKSGNESAR